MNKIIEELKENLPKECCSFCTHLSLEGPNDDSTYNIKCIIFDSLPKSNSSCEYFKAENSDLKCEDLDDLYIDFLEACIKADYKEYLNSIHFKLFKNYALSKNNKCYFCDYTENLDIHHINKNLGRERLSDISVVCPNCKPKL